MQLHRMGRLCGLVLLFTLLVSVLAPAAGPGLADAAGPPADAGGAAFVPGEIVVKLDPYRSGPNAGAVRDILEDPSAVPSGAEAYTVEPLDPELNTFLLHFSESVDVPAVALALETRPGVVYAEPNYLLQANLLPNDPYVGQQWSITQIQADKAWDITTGSESVTIALLDTGVAKGHPDLAGKIVEGYNFIADNNDASDDEGHGTYTAGIAAAIGNNEVGIAGVSWGARIMPVKILNDEGGGPVSNFAKGLRFAADHGARVISISAGVPFESELMAEAVKYAHGKGVVIVAASGNTPDGNPNYPAGYDEVVAVGATGSGDSSSGFSSFGSYVDVTAPGAGILSTAWQNGENSYMWGNGTSASCPMVAGVAALVLSVRPDLSNDQVKRIIEGSADDFGSPGWDEHYGFGRVNAFRAVQAARDGNLNIGHESSIRGRVVGADPATVTVRLSTGQVAKPDAEGNYEFRDLGPGDYTVSVEAPGHRSPKPVVVSVTGRLEDVKLANLELRPGVAPEFRPVPWVPDTPTRRYFPETEHTLSMGFKAFWEKNGGLPVFGFPISEEFVENGYTVQYFERNRFEYHPENAGTRYEILLGLLGSDLTRGRGFADANPAAVRPGWQYFPETANSLSGPFLNFWRDRGGLMIFGYPISEPFYENGFLVQYFERNRFEYHPELPASYQVSLGLLGSQLARERGYIP